jgi:hypothetical protein
LGDEKIGPYTWPFPIIHASKRGCSIATPPPACLRRALVSLSEGCWFLRVCLPAWFDIRLRLLVHHNNTPQSLLFWARSASSVLRPPRMRERGHLGWVVRGMASEIITAAHPQIDSTSRRRIDSLHLIERGRALAGRAVHPPAKSLTPKKEK